jgi:hypothetical protein
MSRVKKLTLAVVGVFFILAFMFSINANADHDDDNYEKQKAAIDRANDGIIGYTEHGVAIYEDEVESSATLSVDRALNIEIKGIKKVKTNVLNVNTLEMTVDEKVYTIIVDCKLTEIDNFQWQTRGDGSLDVGDFGFARRNPFKYFDNPALELSKEQVEAKLENWDLDTRTCIILALQLAGTTEEDANVEKK